MQGKERRFDRAPERFLEGFVVAKLGSQGGECARNGLFAGKVCLALGCCGVLFDDKTVLFDCGCGSRCGNLGIANCDSTESTSEETQEIVSNVGGGVVTKSVQKPGQYLWNLMLAKVHEAGEGGKAQVIRRT